MYTFSQESLNNLQGVDSRLVYLACIALNESLVDFGISDGIRTEEEQRKLYDSGKSKTMNSKHLKGRAIDVFAWEKGGVKWSFDLYERINDAFEKASEITGIKYKWGGQWTTFRDGVHFELVD